MTLVAVSLSAPALDALQLQKILATSSYPVRVLACEQVAGDDRNPIYAYVTANDDGDYLVSKIKLTRTGLAINQYRTASKIVAVDGVYQTLYHALQIVDAQRTGKFRSLSGPPPLSSAMFSLNELGLEPSPLLDGVLADWMAVQDIAPLRYAVYNPQRNEIEVSFQDPSAHNDEEHQLRIKEAIGKQLRELFESKHAVADENEPSGRYTRRSINNRTHNMSIISINLGGDDVASESAAKLAKYTFARVGGAATMVLPSSARAGLTEIKTHLKTAKSDRTKALRLTASHASVLKQAEAASTKERRTALKAKAKTIKGQVSALNKSAKAALTAANKSARAHGLGGLTLPISTDILASAKKLASAKIDVFGATGKRGQFKPRFTPDHKFAELTGKSLHPLAGTKTSSKKAPVKSGMPGAGKGGHSAAREKVAREAGLMGNKRKTTTARGPAGGGKKMVPRTAPLKTMRPGGAAKLAAAKKDWAAEDREQMKKFRAAAGAPIKKSEFRGANYVIDKKGNMLITTKNDVTHKITAANIKKHGVDTQAMDEILEAAGARRRAGVLSAPR